MPELNEYVVEITYKLRVAANSMRQAQEAVIDTIRATASDDKYETPRVRSVTISDIHAYIS